MATRLSSTYFVKRVEPILVRPFRRKHRNSLASFQYSNQVIWNINSVYLVGVNWLFPIINASCRILDDIYEYLSSKQSVQNQNNILFNTFHLSSFQGVSEFIKFAMFIFLQITKSTLDSEKCQFGIFHRKIAKQEKLPSFEY